MPQAMFAVLLAAVLPAAAHSSDSSSFSCFRSGNFDNSYPLATSPPRRNKTSARVVTWNTTIRNFDSTQDVYVTRFDVFRDHSADASDVRLGGSAGVLQLPRGAAYIFSTAPSLKLEDASGAGAVHTMTSTEAAWVSQGSCVHLDVGTFSGANASVLIVSSGPIDRTLARSGSGSSSCSTARLEIGSEDLHNNPVDYVTSGSCSRPLSGPGGAADFDDLDAPIRPLESHYHTRSALYYTAAGASSFNDPGEGPLTSGELRFVTAGHYYGPETMWEKGYYVMSFHESDPSKRSTAASNPPAGFKPCPFACFDKPAAAAAGGDGGGGGGAAEQLMRCVRKVG